MRVGCQMESGELFLCFVDRLALVCEDGEMFGEERAEEMVDKQAS